MNKTLVIAAVNTTSSINLDLARKISYHTESDLLDLNDFKANLAILSTDLLKDKKFPDQIRKIYAELAKYQNIIIVTPEHNGYFSAFFKNILDWLSRLDNQYFLDKNIILVVASPGEQGGKSLRNFAQDTLSFTGAKTVKNFGFGKYSLDVNNDVAIQEIVDYISELE